MQTWHYLDNSATTPLCEEAKSAMLEAMEVFGNPSSLHGAGQEAARLLARARACVANALGISRPMPGELIFTSCGTEASNTALIGTLLSGKHLAGRRVITTDCEHPSVENVMRRLEQDGFEVVRIGAPRGVLDTDAALAALEIPTALVSLMMVNNETGARFDVERVFRAAKQKNPATFTHCDAVQGFLKVPFTAASLGADLITVSGHKIHAPKGVGALYARQGVILSSLIEGGAQERGKRAGTENIPGIMGMAAALEDACAHIPETSQKVSALRDRLIQGLARIPHGALNGDPVHRLPGNVSFCFEGVEGESLLLLLDDKGICASSGSACTSGSLDPSHVLLAIGRPHEVAHGSLRLTIAEDTTQADVDYIVASVTEVVEYLRNMSPLWKDKASGRKPFVI